MVWLCFKYLVWRVMQLTYCQMPLEAGRAGNNCSCSPVSLLADEVWEEASVLFPVQATAEPTAGFVSQGWFSFCAIHWLPRAAPVGTGAAGSSPHPSKSSQQAAFQGLLIRDGRTEVLPSEGLPTEVFFQCGNLRFWRGFLCLDHFLWHTGQFRQD